ncbi:thioredoxin [Raphidocelis subcapitata]|uniref:Thioredoxin n=1 Tax=Raphidocelis subcapitata TaxID=307507 RepID=A0A2V0P4Y9_9CHLO|nr:thioredoxin [Raphidocelis subcapitata]|eukprot:GBF92257.1 thioredoxin [Raphidocelis subcapitata]
MGRSAAVAPACRARSCSSVPSRTIAGRARRTVARVASVERPLPVDRNSVDPLTEGLSTEAHVPGQIWTVHSPAQLQAALDTHSDQLCVLMCKSKACRPCKMFMKKYMDIAERFPNLVLLQVLGDESPDTRKLMVSMKVKVTPTFALYRGGSQVETVTGVSEVKLLRALVDRMTPQELEGHEEDVFELEAAEREMAAQEAK